MYGNSKGWIIAAVLAGVLVLLTYQAMQFNAITPITDLARDPAIFKPLALDVPPASIVPMEQAGDGTALYREAIADVKRRTASYQKYADDGMSTNPSDLPAIQSLIKAGPMTPSPILDPDKDIGYLVESEDLKALALAAKCCERLGLLQRTPKPAEAKKCFEAELALGAKLFDERIIFYEAFDAVGMMRGGAGGLKMLAQDGKKDDELTKIASFDDSTAAMTKKLDRLWTVIGSVDNKQIGTHAGDVYCFTLPGMKERMWRVESTLALGRHKFNSGGRLADAAIVDSRLKAMETTEKDPAIRAAVKAAQNLTIQDYHMIR